MAENELSRSVNEFLSKLQEAMNTMMCSRCQGKHRYDLNRTGLGQPVWGLVTKNIPCIIGSCGIQMVNKKTLTFYFCHIVKRLKM